MCVLVLGKGYVDTEVDDYEKGCTGEFGVSWDFDARGVYDSLDGLMEAVRKATYWSLPDDAFSFYDGSLRFSATVDVDNTIASDAQVEAWRKGEEKLWVADGRVPLCVCPGEPHEMTDDEAEALGLGIY